jgi:hypothetical protein
MDRIRRTHPSVKIFDGSKRGLKRTSMLIGTHSASIFESNADTYISPGRGELRVKTRHHHRELLLDFFLHAEAFVGGFKLHKDIIARNPFNGPIEGLE